MDAPPTQSAANSKRDIQRSRLYPPRFLAACRHLFTDRRWVPGHPTGCGTAICFPTWVASGDILSDRAIIWTRVTPEPAALPGSGIGKKAVVHWQVSTDPGFVVIVATSEAKAVAEEDHTVKVDVTGLRPMTVYYYRFLFKNAVSNVGRFRTAPPAFASINSLRFGLVSCSNYEGGYFSGYRHLSLRKDLDFILHVGDYIYEYEPGAYGPGPAINRVHDPMNEIVTLQDYRRRHAQYKTDPDL